MAANYHGRYFRVLVTRDVLEEVLKGPKWYKAPEFSLMFKRQNLGFGDLLSRDNEICDSIQ